MLRLSDVTLFAIDCFTPEKTLLAMDYSTKWVEFGEVMLLTDTGRFSNLPETIGYKVPLTVIHHIETTRMVPRQFAPHHPPFKADYEMAVMREPSEHVRTPFLIHMEWDSAIINPDAWDPDWLGYDFIGAPWPAHHEPGWPACDGHTNNVGNGGFSLKSMKYARATRAATDKFKGDYGMYCSDMWPCRTIRPWLEKQFGVKFAPDTVASRFSCENKIYSGQFAFHGKHTAEMNNWQGDFFRSIRP